MVKLASEQLVDIPAPCWCCGELTTEHVYGITIHKSCLDTNYGGDEDQLFKDIETEMDSW